MSSNFVPTYANLILHKYSIVTVYVMEDKDLFLTSARGIIAPDVLKILPRASHVQIFSNNEAPTSR